MMGPLCPIFRYSRDTSLSDFVECVKPSSRKVVTWEEAMSARPPLRIDMDGPTPWSYSPSNKPLRESVSPMWTFGRRTFVEKRKDL